MPWYILYYISGLIFSILALKHFIQLVLDFKAQSFWVGSTLSFQNRLLTGYYFWSLITGKQNVDSGPRPLHPSFLSAPTNPGAGTWKMQDKYKIEPSKDPEICLVLSLF